MLATLSQPSWLPKPLPSLSSSHFAPCDSGWQNCPCPSRNRQQSLHGDRRRLRAPSPGQAALAGGAKGRERQAASLMCQRPVHTCHHHVEKTGHGCFSPGPACPGKQDEPGDGHHLDAASITSLQGLGVLSAGAGDAEAPQKKNKKKSPQFNPLATSARLYTGGKSSAPRCGTDADPCARAGGGGGALALRAGCEGCCIMPWKPWIARKNLPRTGSKPWWAPELHVQAPEEQRWLLDRQGVKSTCCPCRGISGGSGRHPNSALHPWGTAWPRSHLAGPT